MGMSFAARKDAERKRHHTVFAGHSGQASSISEQLTWLHPVPPSCNKTCSVPPRRSLQCDLLMFQSVSVPRSAAAASIAQRHQGETVSLPVTFRTAAGQAVSVTDSNGWIS